MVAAVGSTTATREKRQDTFFEQGNCVLAHLCIRVRKAPTFPVHFHVHVEGDEESLEIVFGLRTNGRSLDVLEDPLQSLVQVLIRRRAESHVIDLRISAGKTQLLTSVSETVEQDLGLVDQGIIRSAGDGSRCGTGST